MRIVAIVSGGLDSTVMYYMLKHDKHDVEPVHFRYGSNHEKAETEAMWKVIPEMPRTIQLDFSWADSSLMGKGDIPTGDYSVENLKSTVVPFRNGILLSYAVGIAECRMADCVAYGNHHDDNAVYPDCRPDFRLSMSHAAQYGTFGEVEIYSPFERWTKQQIVAYGDSLGITELMWQTYSCYKGGPVQCGICSTCLARKEAFSLAGVEDKTQYMEENAI